MSTNRLAIPAHWAIFPIKARDKIPYGATKWRDESKPRPDWKGGWPRDANTGIDCGKSGLDILDEDEHDAVTTWLGYTPDTYTVRTGKGRHFYFAANGARLRNGVRVAPGVDIRGEGGYVVGPGSTHETGTVYEVINDRDPIPLPDDIHEKLGARETTKTTDPSDFLTTGFQLPDTIQMGTRADTLWRYAWSLQGRNLRGGEGLALLRTAYAQCNPPFTEEKAESMWKRATAVYKTEPALPEHNQDDPTLITGDVIHSGQLRMAYRLATNYANQLLHVHGIGWHYYDGRRWIEDDQRIAQRAVLHIIESALLESVRSGDKKLRSDATRCESASGVNGVLGVAEALAEFAATVRDLDQDPYVLNVANGTLDLHTLELKPHDPVDRITKVCTAAYDSAAAGPVWDAFLTRVLPDEDVRSYLQRYAGTALCGRVLEHTLAILTGEGRNGKGVFYTAVTEALGDYGQTADPDLFMHRENAHPTGEMDLRGARWVVVSESDKGRRLAEATVKRLTGGDKIKARKMRQDFVEFDPSHTPALVTNHKPKMSGDDPALWARIRVVPFDVVIPEPERDVHLGEKLSLELDAVLTWVIAGWRQYQQLGSRMDEPKAVLVATDKYHAEQDAIGGFLTENCIVNPNMAVPFADLWDRWSSWRIDAGFEEMSKRAFKESLDRAGFESAKGSRNVAIKRGLGLLSLDEDDD